MRIIFAGAGHWHMPIYAAPLRELPEAEIVGVTDHDPARAAEVAARESCAGETDLARLVERQRPDFAIVLGRHSDMARDARLLIDAGVPFAIEKPAGLVASEVEALARAASAAGLYVAVPLVFRTTGFMRILHEILLDEAPLYASFRFLAGLPQRYHAAGCGWMLERRHAGGGVLTNLGIHFIDLISEICAAAEPTRADLAGLSGEGDVEDVADVVLRAAGFVGRVETGYLYPAPTGQFDMHFSVRTERHYVTAIGPGSVEVTDLDGNQTRHRASTTNMEEYPVFVREVLRQVREGKAPVAGLDDLARAMRLIERAYQIGGRGQTTD